MKFIREPKDGIWVAVKDDLTEETVRKRILGREVWFADLDDCDADSPAKKIAKKAIGANYFDPEYFNWCLRTSLALMKRGKEAESERWKLYIENFLRSEKALSQIRETFTSKEINKSLYPGVPEFYSSLPADQYYITRNVKTVGELYVAFLYEKGANFKGIFPETYDKKDLVEGFILEHPAISRYGLSGDSLEDELAVDILKFYHKKEIIAQPISLYRADNPKKLNPNFDINVGKDRTGLVEILNSQI